MKHRLWETGDARAPAVILDRNGEVTLDLCKVCGQGEADLADECPGPNAEAQQFLNTGLEAASLLMAAYTFLGHDEQAASVMTDHMAFLVERGAKAP